MKVKNKSIKMVDIVVGQKIRIRRNLLAVTQEELAAHIGKTFQQVQKYERGETRVSASVLFEIATLLNCSVKDLFPEEDEHPIVPLAELSNNAIKLAACYDTLSVPDKKLAMSVIERLMSVDQGE